MGEAQRAHQCQQTDGRAALRPSYVLVFLGQWAIPDKPDQINRCCSGAAKDCRLDAVFFQQLAQRAAFLAGQAGGVRNVAGAFTHQADQMVAFKSLQCGLFGFVEIERVGLRKQQILAAIHLFAAFRVRQRVRD